VPPCFQLRNDACGFSARASGRPSLWILLCAPLEPGTVAPLAPCPVCTYISMCSHRPASARQVSTAGRPIPDLGSPQDLMGRRYILTSSASGHAWASFLVLRSRFRYERFVCVFAVFETPSCWRERAPRIRWADFQPVPYPMSARIDGRRPVRASERIHSSGSRRHVFRGVNWPDVNVRDGWNLPIVVETGDGDYHAEWIRGDHSTVRACGSAESAGPSSGTSSICSGCRRCLTDIKLPGYVHTHDTYELPRNGLLTIPRDVVQLSFSLSPFLPFWHLLCTDGGATQIPDRSCGNRPNSPARG